MYPSGIQRIFPHHLNKTIPVARLWNRKTAETIHPWNERRFSMMIARTLLAIAAFAATSQASWILGSTSRPDISPTTSSLTYKVVGVMTETSCAGASSCTGTAVGTTIYTVFYIANATGSYAGEAIAINAPNRADSKLIIDQLMEAYRNGWKIQVSNWDGAGKIETVSWQGITKIYRVLAGDKTIVLTLK